MFTKLNKRSKLSIQGILIILAALWLLPLINVVVQSVSGNAWGNYSYLFTSGLPIWRMIFNSLVVSICQVTLIVFVASPAAFAFSKLSFPGKNVLFLGLMLVMSVSMLSFITPLFQTMKTLKLMNTYLAMILPAATFWLPVAILILKNYFDGMGREMLEATMMDGAGYWTIWFKIYFPLSRPTLINVIVFAFINSWNDYLNPLLFSRTDEMRTLPMAVISLTSSIYGARQEVVYAALVVMAIPSILLYVSLQRYLGEGMTAGSVKG